MPLQCAHATAGNNCMSHLCTLLAHTFYEYAHDQYPVATTKRCEMPDFTVFVTDDYGLFMV